MSMQLIPSPSELPAAAPCALARCFGTTIRKARIRTGRSAEQVARSAGLAAEQWADIEAGTLPDGLEHVILMTHALDATRPWADFIVGLYVAARKQQLREAGIVIGSGHRYS